MNKYNNDFEFFWERLHAILLSAQSTDTVYNQYRDCNYQVDLPDAVTRRLKNLHDYLDVAIKSANLLIVGEAAGPWGCRFSGIPFTGEKQLLDPSFPIQGQRSSKDSSAINLKKSPPFISRSAEIFWEVMLPYYGRFLVWDAFPLHSHNQSDKLSMRNPTNKEISQFGEALKLIVSFMNPIHIISVGKKAFDELMALEISSTYVRHPSRGGKAKFIDGINRLIGDLMIC